MSEEANHHEIAEHDLSSLKELLSELGFKVTGEMEVSLKSLVAEKDEDKFTKGLDALQGMCQNAADSAETPGTPVGEARLGLFLIELFLSAERKDDDKFEEVLDLLYEHAVQYGDVDRALDLFNRLKLILRT